MNASRWKLLAGATMPTLSPRRRAAGLIHVGSVKEFTFADQLCRPAQKNLVAAPAHGLRSTGSVHVNRRVHSARRDRCHRRSARTGAGGLCLADTAFEEAYF